MVAGAEPGLLPAQCGRREHPDGSGRALGPGRRRAAVQSSVPVVSKQLLRAMQSPLSLAHACAVHRPLQARASSPADMRIMPLLLRLAALHPSPVSVAIACAYPQLIAHQVCIRAANVGSVNRFIDSGGVYKLAFGPKAFIVVSDPVVVRHLLRVRAQSREAAHSPALSKLQCCSSICTR